MRKPKSERLTGIIMIIAVILLGAGLIANSIATLVTKDEIRETIRETVLEYIRENGLTVNLYTEELKCNVTEINPPGTGLSVTPWGEALVWLALGVIFGVMIARFH